MNLKTLFAYNPLDSEEIRLEKFSIFILATACSIAGTVWAITYYFVLGWVLTILLPALFTFFVGGALIVSHLTKMLRHQLGREQQFLLSYLSLILLQ